MYDNEIYDSVNRAILSKFPAYRGHQSLSVVRGLNFGILPAAQDIQTG